MTIQTILHQLSRVTLVGSAAAIILAFLELAAQFVGISLIANLYSAGRLIELAAALLVLVIAITLREIRDLLAASSD